MIAQRPIAAAAAAAAAYPAWRHDVKTFLSDLRPEPLRFHETQKRRSAILESRRLAMTTNTKTPLQAVVSVICDCLCELPPEDQTRALEAVRVTLGLRVAAATQDHNLVEVPMVSDRPLVETPPTDPRVTVLPPRQQSAGVEQGAARSPGYVRLSWQDCYKGP